MLVLFAQASGWRRRRQPRGGRAAEPGWLDGGADGGDVRGEVVRLYRPASLGLLGCARASGLRGGEGRASFRRAPGWVRVDAMVRVLVVYHPRNLSFLGTPSFAVNRFLMGNKTIYNKT